MSHIFKGLTQRERNMRRHCDDVFIVVYLLLFHIKMNGIA